MARTKRETTKTVVEAVPSCDRCGNEVDRLYTCRGCGDDICRECIETWFDLDPRDGSYLGDYCQPACKYCVGPLKELLRTGSVLRSELDDRLGELERAALIECYRRVAAGEGERWSSV